MKNWIKFSLHAVEMRRRWTDLERDKKTMIVKSNVSLFIFLKQQSFSLRSIHCLGYDIVKVEFSSADFFQWKNLERLSFFTDHQSVKKKNFTRTISIMNWKIGNDLTSPTSTINEWFNINQAEALDIKSLHVYWCWWHCDRNKLKFLLFRTSLTRWSLSKRRIKGKAERKFKFESL